MGFSYTPGRGLFQAWTALLFLTALGGVLTGQEDARSLQRLSWAEDRAASSYEVTVEQLDIASGSYQEQVRETRRTRFIDCSLAPGKYRYRVKAYNLLGAEGAPSSWVYFEIRSASPEAFPAPLPLVQRLAWEPDGRALFYQAVVERREAGEYREIMREQRTQDAFVRAVLPPGEYRYQVTGFDLLGRPGPPSEWVYFAILPAVQPELTRFSPERFTLDKEAPLTVTVYGKNLDPKAEIALRSPSGGTVILPAKTELTDGEARLAFNREDLVPGDYEMVVTSPGGGASSLGGFTIRKSAWDAQMEAAYTPAFFPPFGSLTELFNKPFQPLGALMRLALIPFKWGHAPGKAGSSLGFELQPGWLYLAGGREEEGYAVSAHLGAAHLNLLYRLSFPNRQFALNCRAGGGLSLLGDVRFAYADGYKGVQERRAAAWIPSLAAGLSFQWFIRRPFFISLGADYYQLFFKDDSSCGFIRPAIGAGWLF
jgi:hypothetical protein